MSDPGLAAQGSPWASSPRDVWGHWDFLTIPHVCWQSVGRLRDTQGAGEPTSAMGGRGEMGQPALPKQKMMACHPELQWLQMCVYGMCAHNRVSMCARVGLEIFVTGPRKVFQKLQMFISIS